MQAHFSRIPRFRVVTEIFVLRFFFVFLPFNGSECPHDIHENCCLELCTKKSLVTQASQLTGEPFAVVLYLKWFESCSLAEPSLILRLLLVTVKPVLSEQVSA